tara:strand:- start:197 stop:2041 length:1845 start_codon:yes stop_codon:yes gene_type:complete
MTGFDMGKTSSMMDMMQEGGLTPMSSYQRSFTRPRTPGAALLARALQGQKDRRLLEDYQRAEAERQRKGGLFGSIGGLAGGLLGAALSPFTGGASLALVSGLGSTLGSGLGQSLGAGKSRAVDRSGTVFGQQSFRDVEQASRDFTKGIGERALVSGLRTAATAGLSPDGGIYGKVAGKLRPQDVISASQTALPTASQAALEAGQEMGAEGAGLVFGRGDAYSGLGLTTPPRLSPVSATGTDLSQVALDFDPATAISKNLDIGTVIPENIPGAEMLGDQALDFSFNQLDDFSSMVLRPTEDAYQASLANALSLGEDNTLLDAARTAQAAQATAEEASRSAGSLIGYLERQELGPLADSLRMAPAPSMDPSLTEVVSPYFNLPMAPNRAPSMGTPSDASFLASYLNRLPRFEDGGLIGYVHGGLTHTDDDPDGDGVPGVGTNYDPSNPGIGGSMTATEPAPTSPFGSLSPEQILEQQGLRATPEQLALFQGFDTTGVDTARVRAGQNLLNMTGGEGLSSLGGGFGGRADAVSQGIDESQQSFEGLVQGEVKDFESQVLGTAADVISGGGEFKTFDTATGAPTGAPEGSVFNRSWIRKSQDGTKVYLWNGSEWEEQG